MIVNTSKTRLVIDSSVLIAYFDRENGHEPGFSKLRNHMDTGEVHVMVPSLFYWEIGNWIARKHSSHAAELLSGLLACGFQEYPLDIEIIDTAVDIIKKHKKITFYDATYHSMAIKKNSTFVTMDKKYYREAGSLGHIKLLKDY
jgi:predicted nucleic acid-binding protein